MIPWENYREEGLPELLMNYRVVVDHPVLPEKDQCPPEEVCLTGIRTLYHNQNHIFQDRHSRLEVAFQEAKASEANARAKEAESKIKEKAPATVLSEWDGKGPCPTCKREPLDPETVAARERGLKWLEEHGDE